MYVQINRDLRNQLQTNTIAHVVMGSAAYGLDGPQSDIDMLYLYFDPFYAETFCWERNGWQFKNGDVDENYQEIRHYIQNLIVGESPADYESLKAGFTCTCMADIELKLLFDILSSNVSTYALIKSYIGYVKKDWNRLCRIPDAYVNSYDARKAVSHIIRGMSTIKHLRSGSSYQYTPDKSDHGSDWDRCNQILRGNHPYTNRELIDMANEGYLTSVEIRNALIDELNRGEIARRISIDVMKRIDERLATVVRALDADQRYHGRRIDYGDIRYAIANSGVTYQYENKNAG